MLTDESLARRADYFEHRDAMASKGLCRTCGGRQDRTNSYRCSQCSSKEKARREQWKAAGRCEQCQGQTEGGKARCPRCLAKKRQRRRKQKESGICTNCSSRKSREGKTTCSACFESRRLFRNTTRNDRLKNGLCLTCGAPSGGYAQCRKHFGPARMLRRLGVERTYEQILESQGGVCVYCRKPEILTTKSGLPRHLSVEHDHAKGWTPEAFRGLSCGPCNTILGYLENYPDRFMEVLASRPGMSAAAKVHSRGAP